MKRGNSIILVFVMLLCILFITTTEARETEDFENELRIDLVRHDPSPVQPGEPFDVWFEVRNIYDKDIDNVEIILSAPHPFVKKSQEEYVKNIGTLGVHETKTIKFTLTSGSNTQDGTYTVSLNYYSKRSRKVIVGTYDIKVKESDIDISATTVSIEPEEIITNMLAPGETGKLKFTLKNSGEFLMKDISVKLDLKTATVPLSPIKSTAEKKIPSIPAGEQANVAFDIIILPEIDAGVYNVPISLQYYNEMGDFFYKNDTIGLIVGGVPEIHLELRENTIYNVRGTGEVEIGLVNSGLIDIKAAQVLLKETTNHFELFGYIIWTLNEFEVLSEDSVYIGDIDVDDMETVKYRLKLTTSSKTILLPLLVTYRDATNREYSELKNFEFEIHSKKDMGIATKSYWSTIIIIILVIILFFDNRNWKKLNKQKGFFDYLGELPGRTIRSVRKVISKFSNHRK